MRSLYPAIDPNVSGHLDVGSGHRVYFERCGSPGGIPVVFLHGGPGSGCKADHRQFFDPHRYDIVLMDQRGAGRSTPFGGVEANDTQQLIADLETLREHLSLDRWLLFGGSWGATLALAYAQAFPQRVLGMVLRGSFLARRRDVQWFFSDGASRLLPAQWHAFCDRIGDPGDTDMVQWLHRGIFSSDRQTVERVARAWEAWSGAVVMFSINGAQGGSPSPGDGAGQGADDAAVGEPVVSESAITKARIEMHYARHAYFLAENQLLERSGELPRVPVHIVHGARDLTCPAEAAWALHRAIPGSTLEILRTAGHLSSETPMTDALVRASDAFAERIGGASGSG